MSPDSSRSTIAKLASSAIGGILTLKRREAASRDVRSVSVALSSVSIPPMAELANLAIVERDESGDMGDGYSISAVMYHNYDITAPQV